MDVHIHPCQYSIYSIEIIQMTNIIPSIKSSVYQ